LYAYKNATTDVDDNGVGGLVDLYNCNGVFIRNFIGNIGVLNSPWAFIDTPSSFKCRCDSFLVGNFGDGRINVFSSNGTFLGTVSNGISALSIPGLWGLASECKRVYFASGPADELNGLVGYLRAISFDCEPRRSECGCGRSNCGSNKSKCGCKSRNSCNPCNKCNSFCNRCQSSSCGCRNRF